ncbi:hypothetical protein HELRODRAFT_157785 [Helobdella robusta]|uniref:Uncharacterized protein n=1 Tax=Helobdella robusta TaxID=6412 RepID=T1EMF6_HELRO|nr:hypothetical protein HELRODRAFT_157785 [Helobdella robusta]ESN93806.1 hypothetical protein HELRODRAFT_157785 [Helobdella robusta]
MSSQAKKLVVVGDGMCGKTCLLIAFVQNEFNEKYVPTIFESYVSDIVIDEERTVQTALWDTAGQEDYESLRPLSYPNTDVILICFAINNRDSFENVELKWLPEIRHHCPNTPFVLVGTKLDLRPNHGQSASGMIEKSEGVRLAKCLEAYQYAECSAKTREGLNEVFRIAALAALGQRPRKKYNCCLL